MNTLRTKRSIASSESGMVAVMVTLIMIVVIGLIVVGFAQVTRRALRNTLDTQLSSQAYYAAESGVNDAIAVLRNKVGPITPKPDCTDLAPDYNFNSLLQSTIGNPSDGVSYSCVTIDPTPTSLNYPLTASGDAVVAINSSNGLVSSLTYSWTPTAGVSSLGACPLTAGTYPAKSAWTCPFAVLRTEIVPTDAGNLTRTNLLANDHVNFLSPVRSAVVGTMNYTDNARNVPARCTTGGSATCKVTMNFPGSGSTYYLRLRSLYAANANLTITGVTTGGQAIKFSGVQAHISVTGKAQDVLRRILVAVKLNGVPGTSPTDAIVSGDSVCKRFSVTNGSFDGPEDDIPHQGTNPLCDAGSYGNPTNP